MDELSTESSGESFNIHEAAEEILAESEPQSDDSQGSASEGQPETDPAKPDENAELSPEEILKQVGREAAPQVDHAKALEAVNALGAIHNGLPVKVESPDQLKDLIQKGFDYTKKTMAHAEEVKAFEQHKVALKEEREAFAQEREQHQEVILNQTILGQVVERIKRDDPELFEHLDKLFIGEQESYQRQAPLLSKYEQRLKEMDERIGGLSKERQDAKLGEIRQDWGKGLSEVQSKYAAELGKLGVKPDWDAVQKAWAADASGQMSVEAAMYAVHGKDIQAANASYQKMLATKAKANAAKGARTGVGQGHRMGGPTVQAVAGDYRSIMEQTLSTLN